MIKCINKYTPIHEKSRKTMTRNRQLTVPINDKIIYMLNSKIGGFIKNE